MKDLSLTLAGLLALIFALLPGIPGEKIYRVLVGVDWREEHWQRILRLLLFSVFGLALYAGAAPLLGAPLPSYLSPAALEASTANTSSLNRLFVALLGHFSGSAIAGFMSGLCIRAIAHFGSASAFSSAWDHFVRFCARGHWVVIGLQNGESYSGYIDVADTSVSAQERDIILVEPARFDCEKREYRALEHQSLFIPGELVASVAVIHDPTMDKRIVPVGELVFPKEVHYVQGAANRGWRSAHPDLEQGNTNHADIEQGNSTANGPKRPADHEHSATSADTQEVVRTSVARKNRRRAR